MNGLCQNCKKAKATVFVTDCIPEKHEVHLCEECAAQQGIIIKQHETTNAILQELIKHKAGLSKIDERSCPECGMSFREFQLKGLLGCPNDYEVFRDLLAPLLQRAHEGGTHHVGKVPRRADQITHRRTGLLRLRRELQDAIEQENYELAARVRDQIREIELS